LLCYRCGSHVQDGAEKCWNCGTVLSSKKGQERPSTQELRAQQRTGSRMFGVVYKIGDLIANRYRVKDIVGSGGAGVVYRARDQEIDVDVAVKVINAKLVQTSDEQRLFSRQTKIARKLSHQNVVRLYDEGRDEQRPYSTMQFLEGLSLRKIIDLRKEKKQTFALTEVEPIFNQLCQALDYAHKTTFHGNLKPDNVIVLPDLLKVTDFALLRGLPRKPFLAIQKSRGVNFRYLAPEVRLEVPDLEKSIDIYSLGVILAEMLTGTVYDEAKAELLTLAGSGLEPGVLSVLKRCLARAPKDRYHTAKDLYEDIRAAMTKGGNGRRPMPPPPPEQHPANAAEAPTQRLDITKHGARPVPEPPEVEGEAEAPRPAPVEVAASLALDEEPPVRREGTASFEIDDDMIEGFEAHKGEGRGPKAAPPPVPAPEPVAPSDLVAAAPVPEDDLQDDPNPAVSMDEEEETQAILEPEPAVARAAAEAATIDAVDLAMDEISNSAIELIADPRATNVLRVDRDRQKIEPTVSEPPSNGAGHQTLQPTPLPDSALPEPAFVSAVSRDATQHGRLDGDDLVEIPSQVPRSPTLAYGEKPANGSHGSVAAATERGHKKRPMTRPRMPTIQPSAIPLVSTVPAPVPSAQPASVRPQTMASAVGTIPPEAGLVATPPANNRPLYFTVATSVGAVVLALLIVLKVTCDQQTAATQQIAALTQQMQQMQNLAETARQNQQKLEAEAQAQGVEVAAATKAEEEAKANAEVESKAKAEAEAEARRRAEEAAKAEAAVKAAADAKAKAEAEAKAKDAKEKADVQRQAVEVAAAREAAAQAKADSERRRREEAQRLKDEKEQRAKEEAAAARKAEERAERLAEEQAKRRSAEDAAAAAAEERKRDEERRREEAKRKAEEAKAAEEAKKAEEAKEAKAAEEAKKAEAAKKDEGEDAEPGLAAATEGAAGQRCPRGMVLVPAGAFMMGSARNDPERNFGDQAYTSVEVAGFCMDYYEFPNGRGLAPKTGMNFKAALSACKKKGKRLCTEAEWEKACKGAAGTRYPYGNQWDPTRCNTEDEEGTDREVAKSGTFRKCYSGFKVFDLSGNVGEWTATEWGSGYVVKGGSSDRPGYDGRCAARKKKTSTSAAETLGFRCCSDPE
jgi:formylglycine-generating enzyme required for sulfatase activity